MFYRLLALFALVASLINGEKVDVASNSTLGICGYSATCSAGGYEGACVSIGAGCCSGGTVTSGLCPGTCLW